MNRFITIKEGQSLECGARVDMSKCIWCIDRTGYCANKDLADEVTAYYKEFKRHQYAGRNR